MFEIEAAIESLGPEEEAAEKRLDAWVEKNQGSGMNRLDRGFG